MSPSLIVDTVPFFFLHRVLQPTTSFTHYSCLSTHSPSRVLPHTRSQLLLLCLVVFYPFLLPLCRPCIPSVQLNSATMDRLTRLYRPLDKGKRRASYGPDHREKENDATQRYVPHLSFRSPQRPTDRGRVGVPPSVAGVAKRAVPVNAGHDRTESTGSDGWTR